MRRRKQRFKGAGSSATREFNRQRLENIRDSWKEWLLAAAGIAGFAVWSLFQHGMAARVLAAIAGCLAGALFVIWALGGHVSAFRWWLGAEGERSTAKEIEKLGLEWHCEHDVEHEHGNWDHVVVGPAGVFLLDSKFSHSTLAAGDDGLRSGRLSYRGATFRSGALRVNRELERHLGTRAPWVQAVAVVWGDFPQGHHEDHDVVYLRGDQLVPWLSQLPEKVNAPHRAALVTALQEVRSTLLTPPAEL